MRQWIVVRALSVRRLADMVERQMRPR